MHLRPFTLVRYEREPYFSNIDDYARVTFDTHIRAQAMPKLSFDGRRARLARHRRRHHPADPRLPDRPRAQVHLHVPLWLSRIVERVGLPRRSFSKYGTSIRAFYAPPTPAPITAGGWR
jgi:hypothetical protein